MWGGMEGEYDDERPAQIMAYIYVSLYILKVRRSQTSGTNRDMKPSIRSLSFRINCLPPETRNVVILLRAQQP